nr:MAG TPA: hypothetical protein [Bacteriophage sp.]
MHLSFGKNEVSKTSNLCSMRSGCAKYKIVLTNNRLRLTAWRKIK